MKRIAAAFAAALLPGGLWAADLGGVEHQGAYDVVHPIGDARPHVDRTPGAIDARVTQDNIRTTICVPGYAKKVRPPARELDRLERKQIAEYRYTDRRPGDYREDFLIPLEIGGNPTDPQNVWPQPRHVVGGWGAARKDKLALALQRLVCSGKLPLAQAQGETAGDWIEAYQRYVGD